MKTEKQKVKEYFEIKKNEIICKYDTVLEINFEDYHLDEEILSDNILNSNSANNIEEDDIEYVYDIPGFFDVYIPEKNETVSFIFPFNVFLIKTENTLKENNKLIINYEAGQRLFFVENKSTSSDLKIIAGLLENRIKYLNGNPGKSIEFLWSQLLSTKNIKLHHLELIYTVLYGKSTGNGFVPIRLTKDQKYTKYDALDTKKSSHQFGTTNAYNYGYSNDAILTNVTRKKEFSPPKSDLEKIIAAEYHELDYNSDILKN